MVHAEASRTTARELSYFVLQQEELTVTLKLIAVFVIPYPQFMVMFSCSLQLPPLRLTTEKFIFSSSLFFGVQHLAILYRYVQGNAWQGNAVHIEK